MLLTMRQCLRRASKSSCSLKDVIFLLENYLDFVELCSLAFTCKSIFNLMLKKNSCLCPCQLSHSYPTWLSENVKAVKRHLSKEDLQHVSLISSCFRHPTRIVHLKLGAWWRYLNEIHRFFFARAIVKSQVLTLLIDTSFYTYRLSSCYDKKELTKNKINGKLQRNFLTSVSILQRKDDYTIQRKILYDDSTKVTLSKQKEDFFLKTFKNQRPNHVTLLTQIIHKIFTFEFLQNVEKLNMNGVALTLKHDILHRFEYQICKILNKVRTIKGQECVTKHHITECCGHAKIVFPLYFPKKLSFLKKCRSFFVFDNESSDHIKLKPENLNSSLLEKNLVLQSIAIALRISSLCSDSVEKVLFMPLPDSFTVDLHSNELSFMQLFYTNTFCENVHFPKLKTILFPSTLNGEYVLRFLNSSSFPSLHNVSLLGLNIQCDSLIKKLTCQGANQSSHSWEKLSAEYQWGIYPTQENAPAVYYGSVDHFSRFHGIGIYACKTYTYEGFFREGFNDGYGILNTTYGEQYQGFWKKGYRHGYGISKKLNGTVYEGNWKHDVLHGRGFMKDFHTLGYDGEWFNGLFHGWGVILLRNQIIAIGEFYAGKPFKEFRCRQNFLSAFLKSQDFCNAKTIAYQDIHSPTDYFKILKTIGLSEESLLKETTYYSKYKFHPTLCKAFSLNDISTVCRKPYNFFSKEFCRKDMSTINDSVASSKIISDTSLMYTTKVNNPQRLHSYHASLSFKTLKDKFKITSCIKKPKKDTNAFQSLHSTNWTRIYINSGVNNNVFCYGTTSGKPQNMLLLDADRCHQNYFDFNFIHRKTPIPHWIQQLVNSFLIL